MTDDKKKYIEWLKTVGAVFALFIALLVLTEMFNKDCNVAAKVASVLLVLENGYFAYKAIKKRMDEYNQP